MRGARRRCAAEENRRRGHEDTQPLAAPLSIVWTKSWRRWWTKDYARFHVDASVLEPRERFRRESSVATGAFNCLERRSRLPRVTIATRAPDRQVPFDECGRAAVHRSLLIDRDAIFKVVSLLRVDDFTFPSPADLRRGAVPARAARADRPLTIQMELSAARVARSGGRPGVPPRTRGGRSHRVRDRTVSADRRDRADPAAPSRRGTSIAADAYDDPTDIPLALDRAEQRLFRARMNPERAHSGTSPPSLQGTYEHLTDRMTSLQVSGSRQASARLTTTPRASPSATSSSSRHGHRWVRAASRSG